MSQMFTCGLSDWISCGRFVGCFCIARILVSSEHKLCQIWNTCIVSCIYWSIAFFRKLYKRESKALMPITFCCHDYLWEILIMCSFGVPIIIFVNNAFLLIWRHSSVLNINYARSEIHVSCLVYIDRLLFLGNCWYFFFNKAYYQESYILIIEYSSVDWRTDRK
jgi:hypothetical protein